jgi:hypothetical protein
VTIGNNTAPTTAINLNTEVINTPNIPSGSTSNELVVKDGNALMTRSLSNLIGADNGLAYNETGTDYTVRLGATTAGTDNAVSGQRYVNLSTDGIVTFNRSTGADAMLTISGAADDISATAATISATATGGVTISTASDGILLSSDDGSKSATLYLGEAGGGVQEGMFSLEANDGTESYALTTVGGYLVAGTADGAAGLFVEDNGDITSISGTAVEIEGATSTTINSGGGDVNIGNAGGTTTIVSPAALSAGVSVAVTSTAANLTLDNTNYIVIGTNGATITLTLPDAITNAGRMYIIKSAGAGDITLDATPNAQSIDGLATYTIAGGGNISKTIVSDGTNWYVIGN